MAAASLSTVVLLLGSMASTGVAYRDTDPMLLDVGTAFEQQADIELEQKALYLLRKYMKVNVVPEKVSNALKDDLALKQDLKHHMAGRKPAAALLERARGTKGMDSAALDTAVHRKETPCHCVIKKVRDVDLHSPLHIDVNKSYVHLAPPKSAAASDASVDLQMVDLGAAKTFESTCECQVACLDHCKAKEDYHINIEEQMKLNGVPMYGWYDTHVAAQCDSSKCLCLDAERTGQHLQALYNVSEEEHLDVVTEEIHEFADEFTCLKQCKGGCEDNSYNSNGKIDWEGLCFSAVEEEEE